jgi:ubiquinone/menaquinone biosynthesis C-methylase UbiE
MPIVRKMLELGELRRNEKMFDLGSGDGRIVMMAAKEFGADSTGVEYNHELVLESRQKIRRAGMEKKARIVEADLFQQDYSSADLLTVYLLPSSNARLRPMLERQLRKGSRVVAHDFLIRGWEPVKTVDIEDDGTGRSRTLYLYRP